MKLYVRRCSCVIMLVNYFLVVFFWEYNQKEVVSLLGGLNFEMSRALFTSFDKK